MRQFLTLLVIAVALASCKKNDAVDPIDKKLAGQWEMISVRDNFTNDVVMKPASVPENIDITISFTSAIKGNISGSLTIATSVKGNFSVNQNRAIAIPSMDFSYPSFDIFWGSVSWDQQFSGNITLSKSYSFDSSGHLNINCSNNKTLNFIKK